MNEHDANTSPPTGDVPRGATSPTGPTSPVPPPSPSPAIEAMARLAHEDPFPAGHVLAGRYRIINQIGRGGMGMVYRADDTALNMQVALKFLPPESAADVRRLGRMKDEVRVARQVSHPSVCRVFDITTTETPIGATSFITMEYIDGEDLSSLLTRIGRLHGEKAADISRQVCLGLQAVHEVGLIHRDLKPGNIMIDGRGRSRLTDFGISIFAEGAATARSAGTPQYMAPELLEGGTASTSSDVYALGLVLYEIYTGRCPVKAGGVYDLIEFHRKMEIVSPAKIVPALDLGVDDIIMRCVSRDAAQRPKSALAVAAALPGGEFLAEALKKGQTPSAEVATATPTSTKRTRARRGWPRISIRVFVTFACVVLVSVAAVIAVSISRSTTLPVGAAGEKPGEEPPTQEGNKPSSPLESVLIASLRVTTTQEQGQTVQSVEGVLLNDAEVATARARIAGAAVKTGTVRLDVDADTVRRLTERAIIAAGEKGVTVDLRRRTSATIPPTGPHFLIVRHRASADVARMKAEVAKLVLEPERWVEFQRSE